MRRWRSGDLEIVAGGLLLSLIVCAAAAAAWIAPHNPLAQDLTHLLLPPGQPAGPALGGGTYLLGSDGLGEDVWSRLLYGARTSLIIGFAAGVLGASVGTPLGLVGAFVGGWSDGIITALADVQTAVPFLALAIAAVALVGGGTSAVVGVLALGSWVVFARVVRAEALSLRHRPYVEAARALGASPWHIAVRHLLPAVWGSVLVLFSQQVAAIIQYEAALGFLGLDVPPPQPTWGGMLASGTDYLATAWWISIMPGLALTLTSIALGLLGDGLAARTRLPR